MIRGAELASIMTALRIWMPGKFQVALLWMSADELLHLPEGIEWHDVPDVGSRSPARTDRFGVDLTDPRRVDLVTQEGSVFGRIEFDKPHSPEWLAPIKEIPLVGLLRGPDPRTGAPVEECTFVAVSCAIRATPDGLSWMPPGT